MSASANGNRTYHRGLSKQIIKLNKYSASGATHRKGITATSWQSLLVVANSSTDAHAGSRSQRRWLRVECRELIGACCVVHGACSVEASSAFCILHSAFFLLPSDFHSLTAQNPQQST